MRDIDLKHGERYPEVLSINVDLMRAISKEYGFKIENIIPNNGSNGSLLTIFSAILIYANKKPKVVLNVPNYFRTIHHLLSFKYNIIAIKSDKEFDFPTKNYINAMLKYKPDLIILTTPNNPTGKAIPNKDLIEVLDNLPKKSIAVIDRTLTNVKPEISSQRLLEKYNNKNIVILHSFSKNYGLSHERMGFAITSNNKLSNFLRQFVVLGLNVNAMKSAIKAMKKQSLIKNKIKNIIKSHKILTKFSKEFNMTYYPSDSDYALLKLPIKMNSFELYKNMKRKGISLMGGHEFDKIQNIGDEYIRLYVGEPNRLRKFIRIFKSLQTKTTTQTLTTD